MRTLLAKTEHSNITLDRNVLENADTNRRLWKLYSGTLRKQVVILLVSCCTIYVKCQQNYSISHRSVKFQNDVFKFF